MQKDEVRIVGVSSSPRKNGNTQYMVEEALQAAEKFGGDVDCSTKTELISLAGKKILPCCNCNRCIQKKSYCVLKDDWLDLVKIIIEPIPDGLIFGSPVYFFNLNSQARAFMERFTSLLKKVWDPSFPYEPPDFSRTAAGALAVGFDRNGGVEHTISSIIHWFLIMGFVAVGGFYIGGAGWTNENDSKTAILNDDLSLESARLVGRKVAKTALLLKRGAATFTGEKIPYLLWKEQNND